MADQLGFRQTYKQKGTQSTGGGPDAKVDEGTSGSHRDLNWKKGAAQAKTKAAGKIGPGKNLNELEGGNFY